MLTTMADLYPDGYSPFLLSQYHDTNQGYRGYMFHFIPDHQCGEKCYFRPPAPEQHRPRMAWLVRM